MREQILDESIYVVGDGIKEGYNPVNGRDKRLQAYERAWAGHPVFPGMEKMDCLER